MLRIPFSLFAPAVLLLSAIGAYALRNLVLDVWVMFAAGGLGYLLRRSGYSMPSIVLGVILGDLGESAFVKSMQIIQYDVLGFLGRPIAAVLLIAGLATLALNLLRPSRLRMGAGVS